MSDNLVKRLRDWEHVYPEDYNKDVGHLYEEAADRITELQSQLRWVIRERDDTFVRMLRRAEAAEAKLEKVVEALEEIATDEHPLGWIAIAALVELKGKSDG